MRSPPAVIAIAGITAAASAQGVSFTLTADQTTVRHGDTVRWTITAEFTGYDDPTAYFAGFLGDFFADNETVGLASNPACSMMPGDDPIISGATVGNINIFCWAALGNDDPTNPLDFYEWDVEVSAFRGSLSCTPVGIASVYRNDEWMINADDYIAFAYLSDTVTIGLGCADADLSEPWGVLDNADVTTFVTMFLDDDPAVDHDDNGMLDLADIVEFVHSFMAGCR